jgi:hypothetical protein
MQNEITKQDHFPELTEENLKSAAKRREDYSRVRDLQAKEDNEAIARRLAKDEENKSEDLKQSKSENAVKSSQ